MANSRTENVVKNSGATIIFKLVQIIIRFVIRTVFIRFLGNEYTGVSSLFTDILTVLSLMEMGLDSSMIFSLYKPLVEKDERRIAALMNFYRTAFACIGFGVLALGALCIPFLQHIVRNVPNIKEDIRVIFLMYVLTSGSSYFFVYKTVLIRADQKSRIISLVTMVIHIVECVVEVVLLVLFRQFFAYLIVHFIATVARNIIMSNKAEKMYPQYLGNRRERLSRAEKIVLYKNIGALCVYNLAAVVLSSTDSIFVSAFVGTAEVAVIGNFTLITNNVKSSIKLVVDVTRPSVGNLVASDSVERQYAMFKNIHFMNFWIGCFCSVSLFSLLNPFVGDIWFDASYKISALIVAFMVLNFYFSMMSFVVGTFRSTNGLFVQGWHRPAVMALMNIILDYFMGKRWGIVGIYIATSISLLCTQVWFDPYIVYKYVFKKKPTEYYLLYAKQLCLMVLLCGLTYWLGSLLPVSNVYAAFILKVLLVLLVPNAVIVLLFHKTVEFSYSVDTVKRISRRFLRRR